jgi:hypothetical protein
LAPAAGPGWEEPTSQLYPRFRTELDYVFTHEHSWGRRMMARLFCGTPEAIVAIRRNGLRALRAMNPKGDARASREAISLRTLLRAQSLRGHNGTVGPLQLALDVISVASGMLGLRLASGLLGPLRTSGDHVKTNPRLGRVLARLGHIGHMDSPGRSFLAQSAQNSCLNPSACHPRVPDRTYLSNRRKENR